MINSGLNPYYIIKPFRFIEDLPIGFTSERMIYGPLWAVLNGTVMWLADNRLWLGALSFKLLLLAAWIGTLWLIWKLLRNWPVWHQCVGLLIFGWLPLGLIRGSRRWAQRHRNGVFFTLVDLSARTQSSDSRKHVPGCLSVD